METIVIIVLAASLAVTLPLLFVYEDREEFYGE